MNDRLLYSLILLISIFITAYSQIALKKAAQKHYDNRWREYLNTPVIIVYIVFTGLTVINVIALRHLPLSFASTLESFGYIFVSLLGHFVLKEKFNKKKIVGIVLIVVGVFIFSF